MIQRLLPVLVAMLTTAACTHSQSPSNRAAVRLSASVQSTPASITITWPVYSGANTYTVYRRSPGSAAWGSAVASLAGSATQFVDNTVGVGVPYEYKVRRAGNGTGYGYLRSGIEVQSLDFRGKLVLLVEQQIATALPAEVAQLTLDLNRDGWIVLPHTVDANADPRAVRDTVIADHAADPSNVKAVFILGNVPPVRSGNLHPDGHSQHRGAWTCDGFYGELTSNWTDNSVNTTSASFVWNHNISGDGKFDQTDFPSEVELQVGRVDLSEMLSFQQSEIQLTKAYLDKAHVFKERQFEPPAIGVFFDDLQWVNNALGSSGLQSMAPCVGIGNISEPAPSVAPFNTMMTTDRLFTYVSGSGSQAVVQGQLTFDGVGGHSVTSDVASIPAGGVFNMSFGSYFGDWDNADNYLRALLASGNALVHVWSGIPNWFMHPMAMGDPVGACAKLSMNNSNSNYSQQNGGWQGQGYPSSHMSLMGDPSLRLKYVVPPTGLVATNSSWYTTFTWNASPDTVLGYHIYRIDDASGTIDRITPAVVTGTSFTSNVQFFPGDRYMVRAIKLETSPSGSYHNPSLGDIAIAAGTQITDCAGVVGGTSIPGVACDDGDPDTGDDTYNSNCVCIGIPLDCAGVPGGPAVPGTSCDDGDPGTGDDVYDANCVCMGELIDCLGVTGGTSLPGTPCDDGDPNTVDDAYNAQCICEGTPMNGVEEFDQTRMQVSPNPANDLIVVTSDVQLSGKLLLYTTMGKVVMQELINGRKLQLEVGELASGNYMLLYVPASNNERRSMTRIQITH